MVRRQSYRGILPAMQLPFLEDYSIDEAELRRFTGWLIDHDGVTGLVTNGHTGEIFSLSPKERAEVTRIVVDEVAGKVPVVSGVSAEGINEAVEHAGMIAEAGGDGLLVMPPHHWLRFGMRDEHVVEYFSEIGRASGLNLVVHVYPAWTKASYSCDLLAALAKLEWVTTFKVGTREMSKYARDLAAIRESSSDVTILTCHDEYLLASMVQGVDGALVGFGSFIPDIITQLYAAVQAGDLKKAQALQAEAQPLKEVVYATGEPSSEAHARMKTAMMFAGRLKSDVVRRPIETPTGVARDALRQAVEASSVLSSQDIAAE